MDHHQDPSFCFSNLEDELHDSFHYSHTSTQIETISSTNLIQEIDVYCDDTLNTRDNNIKPLVVVGDCGVGKSVALATWTAHRKANTPPNKRMDYGEYLFYQSIGCSRLSTQVYHLLRRLISSMVTHFQIKETMNLSDDKLPWVLPRLLDKCSQRGRVVIVLDGLCHLSNNDKDIGLKWLPLCLPSNVRMIMSTTTPSDITSSSTDYSRRRQTKVIHTWDEIQRRKWPTISLKCIQDVHVASFIDDYYLSVSTQSLQNILVGTTRTQVIEYLTTHPLSSNPGFITLLVTGICLAATSGYNSVNQCLIAWMPTRSTNELLEKMLTSFEDHTFNLLGDALSFLFVSRHGLHENEVLELLERVRLQNDFDNQTEGTAIPVKIKIIQMLTEKKNRLIDVFRQFDTDGNGTLSHDEFQEGIEKLNIDVSSQEVTQLINEVDNNGDGEIDYQEALDHFDQMVRSFIHGKRRVSVFVRNMTDANNIDTFSMTKEQKQNLLKILKCVGVSCLASDNGTILVLPFENTALRDVIWKKYIKDETNEAQIRNYVIENSSKRQPNLRVCEELPWQLKKVSNWPALKKIVVDLRTLDIMFNSESLKGELFNYLCILTTSKKLIKFDIVKEYNKSIHQWATQATPPAKHISLMSKFISDVMQWFDDGISSLGFELPPFLRERLPNEYLQSMGVDLTPRERSGMTGSPAKHNSQIESESRYYFMRWIWIQFPWIALAQTQQSNSSLTSEGKRHIFPSATNTSRSHTVELSVRDKAMLHPSGVTDRSVALAAKLINLESDPKPRTRPSTASIPFSTGTSWENRIDLVSESEDSSYERAVHQLREVKSIHDDLAVDVEARLKQVAYLNNVHKVRRAGEEESHKKMNEGTVALVALHTRLEKIDGLCDTATNVDLAYQDILCQLHIHADQSQHIQLKQQVVLSCQQIADLTNEKKKIEKGLVSIEDRTQQLVGHVKGNTLERQRIKPVLESLRARANEEAERRKTARVKSFDPASFSRRVRIEGKIAKRRELKLKNQSECWKSTTGIEAGVRASTKLHPMEKLAHVAGTRDPTSIMEFLDDSETKQLQNRQEQAEIKVKMQLANLDSIARQKQLGMADGNNDMDPHAASVDDNIANEETRLSIKQKGLDSATQLVQDISLAILSLNDKVSSLEDEESLHQYAQFTMDATKHTRLLQDVQRLIQSIKTLHNGIPSSELGLLAIRKSSSDTEQNESIPNIRVLNREERENAFVEASNECENGDGDYEHDIDNYLQNLSCYVNMGLRTTASQNEQRHANLISGDKVSRNLR